MAANDVSGMKNDFIKIQNCGDFSFSCKDSVYCLEGRKYRRSLQLEN